MEELKEMQGGGQVGWVVDYLHYLHFLMFGMHELAGFGRMRLE